MRISPLLGTMALLCAAALAETNGTAPRPEIYFRADYHRRDLGTNTAVGKGNVYLRQGEKELWSDEVEIDFSTRKAIANGNVHIKDGPLDMWGSHITYHFSGEEAVIHDATIVNGQLVMTGATIHKLSAEKFKITDGTYTNCNLGLVRDKAAGNCPADWKLYGKSIDVTVEGYAHLSDAIVYTRDLPVLYTPYFVFPVKSKRQSGFLFPGFSSLGNLGGGFTLPYYQVLGPWHDMTITPNYSSKTGYHIGTNYRYTYSDRTAGELNFFFTQRRFGPFDSVENEDESRSRILGVVGEWAFAAQNTFPLGERAHSLQIFRLVSNPYFTRDYAGNIPGSDGVASLRSQVSATLPDDNELITAKVQHHQSLVISRDTGVDGGGVTQLPSLSYSRTNSPVFSGLLSWEFDTHFTNYYRPTAFDQVPFARSNSGINRDTDPLYDENDYIRTGRRLQVEPRLVANVPMPPGFQFQPVLKAGSLLYHFDVPRSEVVHREYLEAELPVSLYLSRNFQPGIEGFETVNHVFQPRFIYAESPYQSDDPAEESSDPSKRAHPFFFRNRSAGLTSPRFDIIDQISPFQYMRFELINRFRRKSLGTIERFFLLQVSNQYNLRTTQFDPRYKNRLGPIELLSQLSLWRFAFQVQANYQLEIPEGQEVRESDWSSTLSYSAPNSDRVQFDSRFITRADANASEQTIGLKFYKTLPVFFNLSGETQYSLKRGEWMGYAVGFYFETKPQSCWTLSILTGRNVYKESFAFFNFGLRFGNPNELRTL